LQTQSLKLNESILRNMTLEEKQMVVVESNKACFRTFNSEQKKDLAKMLIKLSFFVGIKEPLSLEELRMEVNFLTSEFPNCTLTKLENAFYKMSSGTLGEIEHYQSFSPSYIGKVIRAYESFSKPAMIKYQKLQEADEAEAQSKEKAKHYDPVIGCIEALKIEYERHSIKSLDKFNMFDEYLSKWAVEIGQKIGLFTEFNQDEITHKEFIGLFFIGLRKDNQDMAQAIENYVSSHRKNMEH
jgi:hypothetical protein